MDVSLSKELSDLKHTKIRHTLKRKRVDYQSCKTSQKQSVLYNFYQKDNSFVNPLTRALFVPNISYNLNVPSPSFGSNYDNYVENADSYSKLYGPGSEGVSAKLDVLKRSKKSILHQYKYNVLLSFLAIVTIISVVVALSVKTAEINCSDSSDDGLELQRCKETLCKFDTSLCAFPCPFGFTSDADGCPNSCVCASSSDKFEGDIQFDEPQLVDVLKRYGIEVSAVEESEQSEIYLWNRRRIGNRYKVPYVLDTSYSPSYKHMIKEGMELISNVTCVDFVPRSTEFQYLRFVNNFQRCSSWIGRLPGSVGHRGRGQVVKLQEGLCEPRGVVAHEIMHALGFPHEQARPDRDEHVRILFENIHSNAYANFQKLKSSFSAILNTPYDPDSVMHYSGFAFSVDRSKPTILRIDNGLPPVKQRMHITELDALGINRLYKCSETNAENSSVTPSTHQSTSDKNMLRWGPWGNWEGCSSGPESCWFGGIGVRERKCISGSNKECRQAFPSEDSVDFTTCALNQCYGGAASWHEWGPWNKCSQSCGGGKSLRYFVVKKFRSPATLSICGAQQTEARICNNISCSDIPTWSLWEVVVPCSKTCGEGAVRTRQRFCLLQSGMRRERSCEGEAMSIEECEVQRCPYDDQVSFIDHDQQDKEVVIFSSEPQNFTGLCNENSSNVVWLFGDFNGDGIGDVLCREPADPVAQKTKTFYVGLLGRDSEVVASYSVGLVQECYVEGTKFAVDINGDGLDDVVCKEERNGVYVAAIISNGGRFWFVGIQVPECASDGDVLIPLDFDGDGSIEFLCKQADRVGYALLKIPV